MFLQAKASWINKNLINGKCPKWQTVLQAKSSWINKNLNDGKCPKWQKSSRVIKI